MIPPRRFVFSWLFFFWMNSTIACTNEAHDDDLRKQEEHVQSVEEDGYQCIIFAREEGDIDRCQCPEGFVLCNEDDVMVVSATIEKLYHPDKVVAKKITDYLDQYSGSSDILPRWTHTLCDDLMKGNAVYVDYEMMVRCAGNGRQSHPQLEFTNIGVNISDKEMRTVRDVDDTAVARRCFTADFYLCRPRDEPKVDCEISEWSNWTTCHDNTQRRTSRIVRSGQHGGQSCLWRGMQPQAHEIEDIQACREIVAEMS